MCRGEKQTESKSLASADEGFEDAKSGDFAKSSRECRRSIWSNPHEHDQAGHGGIFAVRSPSHILRRVHPHLRKIEQPTGYSHFSTEKKKIIVIVNKVKISDVHANQRGQSRRRDPDRRHRAREQVDAVPGALPRLPRDPRRRAPVQARSPGLRRGRARSELALRGAELRRPRADGISRPSRQTGAGSARGARDGRRRAGQRHPRLSVQRGLREARHRLDLVSRRATDSPAVLRGVESQDSRERSRVLPRGAYIISNGVQDREKFQLTDKQDYIKDCCVGCVWNINEPSRPTKMFYSPSPVTACCFHCTNNNIVFAVSASPLQLDLPVGSARGRDLASANQRQDQRDGLDSAQLDLHDGRRLGIVALEHGGGHRHAAQRRESGQRSGGEQRQRRIIQHSAVQPRRGRPTDYLERHKESDAAATAKRRKQQRQRSRPGPVGSRETRQEPRGCHEAARGRRRGQVLRRHGRGPGGQRQSLSGRQRHQRAVRQLRRCWEKQLVVLQDQRDGFKSTQVSYRLPRTRCRKIYAICIQNIFDLTVQPRYVYTRITLRSKAGCKDGSIRLHSLHAETPLMKLKDEDSLAGIRSIQWSRSRPTIFYVLDDQSRFGDHLGHAMLDDIVFEIIDEEDFEQFQFSALQQERSIHHWPQEHEENHESEPDDEPDCDFRTHNIDANDGIIYECATCGKKFSTRRNLEKHIDRVQITYACDTCGEKFSKKGHLRVHIVTSHVDRIEPHSTKTSPKKHIDDAHNDIALRSCDACRKIFSNKTNLKRHVDVAHMGVKYTCLACRKSFSTRNSLQTHIDSVHNKIAHKCDVCGKKFSVKSSLKAHMASVHNSATFACHLCDKKFSFKGNLKVHVVSVHGDVANACQICQKTFRREENLKSHVDAMHNGQAAHACDRCGKKFAFKSHLQVHVAAEHRVVKTSIRRVMTRADFLCTTMDKFGVSRKKCSAFMFLRKTSLGYQTSVAFSAFKSFSIQYFTQRSAAAKIIFTWSRGITMCLLKHRRPANNGLRINPRPSRCALHDLTVSG
ncbi:unnamed protein product, partial [Trichogramma brassicae]